jgi:uncharacterized protein YndB with AHSA1/START domain
MTGVDSSTARAVADLTAGVVVASVDIAAPPERVFRALTDPRELATWWGSPDDYRTEQWSLELRVGGRWEARGQGADGRPFRIMGEFLVIEPGARLVQTWRPSWEPGLATTLAYRLDLVPGGTRVTVRHEGFAHHDDACRGHAPRWERVLTWLAGYASSAAVRERPAAARYLNPPRIAAALLVVYALAHTGGALLNTPHFSPAADTVLTAMRTVQFPASGVERTWFHFFFGFGLIDSVFFLVSAAIAWFLGGRSLAERGAVKPVIWALFLGYAASIPIILKDFFLMPLIFSMLITACFGIECWRAARSAPARG